MKTEWLDILARDFSTGTTRRGAMRLLIGGGQACAVPDQNPGQVCDPEIPASCASGICGCGPGGCTCREETCAGPGESCASTNACCDSLCYALQGFICGPLP